MFRQSILRELAFLHQAVRIRLFNHHAVRYCQPARCRDLRLPSQQPFQRVRRHLPQLLKLARFRFNRVRQEPSSLLEHLIG